MLFFKVRYIGNNLWYLFLDELKEEKGVNFFLLSWYKVKYISNRKKGSDE